MTLTADDLDAAVDTLSAALRPAVERDWSRQAGVMELDCWHVAEHIGDCLLSYAGQLVARPDGRYVRFLAKADDDASPAEVLEFAETGARILAATVRSAEPDARAYHPSGRADVEGFVGMGCVETLLHGEDIANGLGSGLTPATDLCERLLARMFPHARDEMAGLDAWTALRWYTGRLPIPGREPPAFWHWRAEP
jgi:uncharacterized protein (TIGR03083 family)